jgi:uracil permease
MISVVGVKSLVENKVNLDVTKNMVIVAVMLTIGVGGAIINYGTFSLSGVGLAAVVGIILNLLLPNK